MPGGQAELCSSVSVQNTQPFTKRVAFGWKQPLERGKLPNQEPFSAVRAVLSLVTAVTSLCVQHLVPMAVTHSRASTAPCSSSGLRAKGAAEPFQPGDWGKCAYPHSAARLKVCSSPVYSSMPGPAVLLGHSRATEHSLCTQGISCPKCSRAGDASCATCPTLAGHAGIRECCPGSCCALRSWERGGEVGAFPGSEAFTWDIWRMSAADSTECL